MVCLPSFFFGLVNPQFSEVNYCLFFFGLRIQHNWRLTWKNISKADQHNEFRLPLRWKSLRIASCWHLSELSTAVETATALALVPSLLTSVFTAVKWFPILEIPDLIICSDDEVSPFFFFEVGHSGDWFKCKWLKPAVILTLGKRTFTSVISP